MRDSEADRDSESESAVLLGTIGPTDPEWPLLGFAFNNALTGALFRRGDAHARRVTFGLDCALPGGAAHTFEAHTIYQIQVNVKSLSMKVASTGEFVSVPRFYHIGHPMFKAVVHSRCVRCVWSPALQAGPVLVLQLHPRSRSRGWK